MSGNQSVRRGVAVVSSGALVVGAGAAVGALAAAMSDEWAQQAALEAAAQVVTDPVADVTVPRPVVITVIEERHVTPEPVVVHRTVYIRVPARQGGSAPQAQAPRAKAAPQRQPAPSAAKSKPSRTVIAPAPAPPAPPAAPSAPKAKSTTS